MAAEPAGLPAGWAVPFATQVPAERGQDQVSGGPWLQGRRCWWKDQRLPEGVIFTPLPYSRQLAGQATAGARVTVGHLFCPGGEPEENGLK